MYAACASSSGSSSRTHLALRPPRKVAAPTSAITSAALATTRSAVGFGTCQVAIETPDGSVIGRPFVRCMATKATRPSTSSNVATCTTRTSPALATYHSERTQAFLVSLVFAVADNAIHVLNNPMGLARSLAFPCVSSNGHKVIPYAPLVVLA